MPKDTNDALAGEMLNLTDIAELDSQSDVRFKRFDSELDALSDFSVLESEIRERWNGVTDLPARDRRRLADKEIAKAKRAAIDASSETRDNAIKELRELGKRADAALKFFASPVQVLARESLGTPERSRYAADVAHSGPVELREFARMAAATGNRALGAAVHARLNGMKASDRKLVGVSSQALAEKLVGDDFKKATAHLQSVRLRTDKAIARNMEIQSQTRNAFRRLELAERGSRIDPADFGE